MVSSAAKIGSGEPTELREYPVARRVWTEPSKGRIYEELQTAKQDIGEKMNVAKNGTTEQKAELSKDYPGWRGVEASFTVFGKQVGDLQKRKAAIIDGKLKVPDDVAEKAKIDERILALNNKMLLAYKTQSARW